jgi:hypothetical protein
MAVYIRLALNHDVVMNLNPNQHFSRTTYMLCNSSSLFCFPVKDAHKNEPHFTP